MAAKDADLASDYGGESLFLIEEKLATHEVSPDPTVGFSMVGVNDLTLFTVQEPDAVIEIEAVAGGGGAGPASPPVVTNFTPAGPLAARDTPVVFDVTDVDPGLAMVLVSVLFDGWPTSEATPVLAYNGLTFEPPFSGFSTITPIANGFTFSLLPGGGWPANILNVRIYAADLAGAVDL